MATLTQNHLSSLLFISIFLSFLSSSSSSNTHLHVADFGASDDGETDASPSFLAAWNIACNSELPTTIYIPRRRYFLTSLVFQGPCMSPGITLHITGILVAPDYIEMGSTENWITFDNVERVSIIGGFLDAQGSDLWDCKRFKRKCPAGATSLAIFSSKNIVIRGLSSMDAKLYHIVVHSCENVTLDSVRIYAPEDSPNTDGIHVQNAVNVQVVNTGIMTGDDCISIGPGTRNLWIQRVFCGPGHGISIGSLGKGLEEDGVVNVTVTNAVFSGTTNGLRIKSWGRPSNGYVKGVVFKRVMMRNVKNPILIDQNYCPRNEGCPNQNSGIKISQVTYADIRGTSASQVAVKFDCSAAAPCKAIGLENIELTYKKKPAESFCRNIRGVARDLCVGSFQGSQSNCLPSAADASFLCGMVQTQIKFAICVWVHSKAAKATVCHQLQMPLFSVGWFRHKSKLRFHDLCHESFQGGKELLVPECKQWPGISILKLKDN